MRGNSQRAANVGSTDIFNTCSCDCPVASMPAATMRSSASRTRDNIGLALRRQRNGIAAAQEYLEAQLVFEAFDPLADGGGGDELLFAGAREIPVPRRTLDDLQ